MRHLCVDMGNTFSKVGLFEDGKQIFFEARVLLPDLQNILQSTHFERVAVCSVKKNETEINTIFEPYAPKLFIFTATSKIPINNNYGTPLTLGNDRLAAAVGAATLYPQQNTLIIDMGTCLKYDWVTSQNTFEGGMIAPGMMMRFKAMHEFTAKLPLFEDINETAWPHWIGKSTEEAMRSGVQNGIIAEINGVIEHFEANLTNFKIILTGGDAIFFESRLKKPTFVIPYLVLQGLDSFLTCNYGV